MLLHPNLLLNLRVASKTYFATLYSSVDSRAMKWQYTCSKTNRCPLHWMQAAVVMQDLDGLHLVWPVSIQCNWGELELLRSDIHVQKKNIYKINNFFFS